MTAEVGMVDDRGDKRGGKKSADFIIDIRGGIGSSGKVKLEYILVGNTF